jgi:hypothetical protein
LLFACYGRHLKPCYDSLSERRNQWELSIPRAASKREEAWLERPRRNIVGDLRDVNSYKPLLEAPQDVAVITFVRLYQSLPDVSRCALGPQSRTTRTLTVEHCLVRMDVASRCPLGP